MNFIKVLLIVTLGIFALTACEAPAEKPKTDGDNKKTEEQKDNTAKTDEGKDEKAEKEHWTYEGEKGVENWDNLEIPNNACNGKVQSPIDIITKDAKKGENLSAIKFEYGESDANIVNNGHTIQFNVNGDNKITLGDKEYKLLQFHYHAGSEHKIDGKQFPLEVHFVHKNSDTDFAVLSVMFKEGAENAFLKNYMKDFPAEKGEKKGDSKIALKSLFPKNTAYFTYKGSLTTPPCSEVVTWYVLKNPVTASKEQLDSFGKMLKKNFRPVEPLEGREVKTYSE